MDYKWHYDSLINTRKLLNRKKYKGVYYEKHHIIMKSMGGSNDKSNLVLLTAREHFLAHWLLWKIHRNRQTAFAFHKTAYAHGKIHSSRMYEIVKEAYSHEASLVFKETWKNPEKRLILSKANSIKNKGRKHTKESRNNMSKAHLGFKQTKETIEKRVKANAGKKMSEKHKLFMSILHKGKIVSEETRKKMSKAAKNRKEMSNETRNLMVAKMSANKKLPRKNYELISPTNEKYFFHGMKSIVTFCKEHNMSIELLKKFKNKGKVISKTSSKNVLNTIKWKLNIIILK